MTTDTSMKEPGHGTRRRHPASPAAMLTVWPTHRTLIADLTRRAVASRYTGTFAGLLWAFASPLALLAIYTTVFGVVFGSKWNQTGSTLEFALMLFAGMVVLNLFNECMTKAPQSIVSQQNFVKKVPFPLEVFPWVIVAEALFHALVGLAALVAFNLAVTGSLHWQTVLLPLVLLPMVLICLGMSYFLCALGVYLRDIGQLVGLLAQALLFLSPVFYPYDQAPPALQAVLAINPLTYTIEDTRAVVLQGMLPSWADVVTLTGVGIVCCWSGFLWFQRTRDGFSDVL